LLDVLGELAACERVIIVDACKAGERPGSTYRARLDPRDWPPAEAGHSLHNMGVLHALSLHLLAGGGLGEVVLISMEPAEVTFGKGLSEAVEARLPELIRAVRDEILNDGNPRRGGEE
jgi:hydrogenase maturation protease